MYSLKIVSIKKESTTNTNNYRPISILPIFSKIIESIVNKQLINFLETKRILIKTQFGFRKKHSTTLALADLISDIAEKLDKGYITFGIFIDLKKAFDTINHDILFNKLQYYGIRGLPLLWFKNYLYDRKQSVKINNTTSTYRPMKCGVPQGSILGPILFLIYINDINNSTNAFDFRLFADDTNLFQYIICNTINLAHINTDFQRVCEWCSANKLTLNVNKTKFMTITTPRKHLTIEGGLGSHDSQIEGVTSINYLGISIDQYLNWKPHIEQIRKLIAPKVGVISQIRHHVPKSILLLIYNSLILPHISYCLEIWGNTYPTLLEPILLLQKKVVRLISFADYHAHTAPLFKTLGILNIHQLCKYKICLFVFDLNDNRYAHDITHYLSPLPHQYSTRLASGENYYIPKMNLTLCQHTLKYAATKHWNSLPDPIKIIKNRTTFKNTLKHHILNSNL